MDDILHIPQTSWIYSPLYTLLPNRIYSPLYTLLPNWIYSPLYTENSQVVLEYSEMVLPSLTFMVDPTMNVRGGSTILRTPGVPKNYSLYTLLPNNFGNPSSLINHTGDSNNLVNYLKDSGFINNIISYSIGMC